MARQLLEPNDIPSPQRALAALTAEIRRREETAAALALRNAEFL